MDNFPLAGVLKIIDTATTVALLFFFIFAFVKEWVVTGRAARRELGNLRTTYDERVSREKEIALDYKQAWEVAQASSETTQEQFRAIMAALEKRDRDERSGKESV